ncbi:MAG: flavodoxin family protein [Coriobacteriales bacterium]|nr:flavodoxin family protein [Coriobacteriales bacterium]
MKVLLINGSPHEKKCTYTALQSAQKGLEANGVAAEFFWIGTEPIKPCVACGACDTTQRCAFGADDGINTLIEKLQEVDGVIVASPVYYAGINGSLKSVLDRAWFAASSTYAFKPAASIVSARRGGTTVSLDQINKYFLVSQMPVVSSLYWPMVHGQTAEQVLQDTEGVQVAYQLGANMAWLLKSIQAGKQAGIVPVPLENRAWTNFIR